MTSRHYFVFVACGILLICPIAMNAEEKGNKRLDAAVSEPMIRLHGIRASDGKEASCIGLSIHAGGVIAVDLASIEGLTNVRIDLGKRGKRTPRALVYLPSARVALAVIEEKLVSAEPVSIEVGDPIQVLSESRTNDVTMLRTLVRSQSAAGEVILDIGVAAAPKTGILRDARMRCFGIVVERDDASLSALTVSSLRDLISDFDLPGNSR